MMEAAKQGRVVGGFSRIRFPTAGRVESIICLLGTSLGVTTRRLLIIVLILFLGEV